MTPRGLARSMADNTDRPAKRRTMQNPHPPSRSRAPIPVSFVGAQPRETPRASVRPAPAAGYQRLVAAFPHLPEPLLVEMVRGLEEARFMPGETIVREGDPADRFYIIESGQVEGTQSPRAGDVHALTMQAGDYFGEVGLLATRTRTATVRAVSEVRVMSVDHAQFQALVDASESTVANLARSLTSGFVAQFRNELVQALSAAICERSRHG